VRVADFDYSLPPELIAQAPAPQRDTSRLLVLHRPEANVEHRSFRDILDYLKSGDVLVLNNSKVIAARLRGNNAHTGGSFEILLLERTEGTTWWAMMRPGKRARVGTTLNILDTVGKKTEITATVIDTNAEGHRLLRFHATDDVTAVAENFGEIPLPPYITRPVGNRSNLDRERYQTVYAKDAGSVAAPTAGLHFTESLLEEVSSQGVLVCYVTLHVGLGTFAPVKVENVEEHPMHSERYTISSNAAQVINQAKAQSRRVVTVGTTTTRVLESAAQKSGGALRAESDSTSIFIYPPFTFKIVDALLTNFHLPRSTLLMLISAFADPAGTQGRQKVLRAYAEAINQRYRFFSYGDAMLIL